MKVQSYLFFDGRCEEAIKFYQEKLGAEVQMLMRFNECPDKGHIPKDSDEKVMHSCFRVGETEVMASDGNCLGKPTFEGFSLALNVPNEATAKKYFDALGAGGTVQMPLGKTFFSPAFGMVADKFGVGWMVVTDPQ